MNVLVVDDEKDVKFLFQQKFRHEIKAGKINLCFAFSAKSAMKKLEETTDDVSLVLSDINMPEMNGLELLRLIKKQFSALQVWMMTAYDDRERQLLATTYGCEEYMTKPIDFELLKQKIFSAY